MDTITWSGLAGWRWMFILEGIPAIILGIVVLFYLTNKPANAKWLTTEEKTWLEGELDKERKLSAKLNKTSHLGMLKDSKLWKLALFNIAGFVAVNALSYWMPTIIKSLSSSSTTNLQIGWLAMIPSIIAIPSILFTGWNADQNELTQIAFRSMCVYCYGWIYWMCFRFKRSTDGLNAFDYFRRTIWDFGYFLCIYHFLLFRINRTCWHCIS